ncbi:hypothetical protein GCM10028791_17360 [Echinicola sediminis]
MLNKERIIYWLTTGLVAIMMLFSAFAYFTNPEVQASFVKLGFPDFFRIELGVAKILGALVLLIPGIPQLVKTGAYAGFAIVFVSAFIAHLAIGDPIAVSLMPLVFLVVLLVSLRYQQKQVAPIPAN